MIKLLRKLEGKKTYLANTAGIIGTGLAATGLGVDPVQLAAAVGGSVDAITNLTQAWDAGRAVEWQQVGIGSALLTASQVLVYYFRAIAKK